MPRIHVMMKPSQVLYVNSKEVTREELFRYGYIDSLCAQNVSKPIMYTGTFRTQAQLNKYQYDQQFLRITAIVQGSFFLCLLKALGDEIISTTSTSNEYVYGHNRCTVGLRRGLRRMLFCHQKRLVKATLKLPKLQHLRLKVRLRSTICLCYKYRYSARYYQILAVHKVIFCCMDRVCMYFHLAKNQSTIFQVHRLSMWNKDFPLFKINIRCHVVKA